ncbi:MAG: hydrogenase maturation nickel metallochaperone HypA [Propionibacteriaceae bacterium]|jgi:hydrogenase nickel incorporation protein HypA/HybF|nr:hydrogenase maturation nickel metallochaperone HypA [Propionibacteriaceae bacterium]
MHELGLLTGVVTAVTQVAESRGATGVEKVGLRVGTMSGTHEEALCGAWPLATQGTLVDGAILEIETIQAQVWCPQCEAKQDIDEFFALVCPQCSTPTGNLVSGKEFEVTFADLRDN